MNLYTIKLLIMFGGITTFSLFLISAYIGMSIMQGKKYSISTHKILAILAITFAVIHGFAAYYFIIR